MLSSALRNMITLAAAFSSLAMKRGGIVAIPPLFTFERERKLI